MTAHRELLTPTGRRELLVTLALTGIAVLAFASVFALVSRFHAWQLHLADRLYRQGARALKARVPRMAIDDFRSALSFDQDNYLYQFSLAEALEADNRVDEAHSYWLDLYDRKPEDGAVNLELGRLAAQQRATDRVLRYYHNAIYGLWEAEPETNRHTARLELIEYLLRDNRRTQAESEIIAMQAGLPADPQLHAQVASLLLRVQDNDRALDQYRRALQLNPRNPTALAGAGEAAFRLGHFRTAVRYLRSTATQNSTDDHSRQLLQMASTVLDSNPFERKLSLRERQARLRAAFDVSSKRLLCMQARSSHEGAQITTASPSNQNLPQGSAAVQDLLVRRDELQRKLRNRAFLSDSDSADEVMDFVSDVEKATQNDCGPPSTHDQALLLIAQYRSGADR
jgi:tetratricopeptide (TPR) repeat protein